MYFISTSLLPNRLFSTLESFLASPVYYPLPSRISSSSESSADRRETEPLMAGAPSFVYTDGEVASLACLTDIDSLATAMPQRRKSSSEEPPSYQESYDNLDLELQSKYTLPRPRSRGWYQTTLWHLSNRPMETWMAAAAVTLAFFALLLLIFLVFILVMQSMGTMDTVYAAVDQGITSFHKGTMSVMCVLAGPACPTEI